MVVLRLVAQAPDIDAFIAQYGRYLHGEEIFLATPAPALRGTHVRFRLELSGGQLVLAGKGTVRRVHGGHPNLIPGMDVAFEPLDERSRALVARMQQVHMRPRPSPSSETSGFSLEPEAGANACRVCDGGAAYRVEWRIEESRLFARVRDPKLAPVAYVVGAALLSCVIVWVARSRSVTRAAPAAAIAALAAAPSPSRAPGNAVAAPNVPSRSAVAPRTPSASTSSPIEPKAAAPAARSASATASLEVTTRPPGATVSVDGKTIGSSPLAVTLSAGPHAVSVTKARYAPVASTVDVPGKLTIALKRPSGTLVVQSNPSAADVVIQGRKQGKTPLRLDVAAFQRYDVQVAFAGGKVWRQKVYLKAPTTSVLANLAEASLTRR